MRVRRIRYDTSENPAQAEFQADETSKFLHFSGGFGSGKSHGLAMKIFRLSRVNINMRGGIVVPSLVDFKKDLLPVMEDIMEVNRVRHHYHKSEQWFRFPWSKGRVYVASAEKKLRGPNWAFAAVNEASLITHERYKEAVGRVRLRGAACPQIASSGTPEGTRCATPG